MARRLTTSRRGSSKHNNSWGAVVSSTALTIPAASKVLLGSLTLNNPNIDETVLRVIGNLTVMSDQTGVEEFVIGSVGLIVVSNQAVAAGIASIPGSSTDSEDDGWFAHQFFSYIGQTVATQPSFLNMPFESKGRRVVQEGEAIAIVAENIHASQGLKVILQFRILSRVTGT